MYEEAAEERAVATSAPSRLKGSVAYAIEPATGRTVVPTDCYGWFHDSGPESLCDLLCPQAKACRPLTREWREAAGVEVVAKLDELAKSTGGK